MKVKICGLNITRDVQLCINLNVNLLGFVFYKKSPRNVNLKDIKILSKFPQLEDEENLKSYILDKLDISNDEFSTILSKENKNFRNYKSYHSYLAKFSFFARLCYKFNFIPKILYLRYFG